MTVAVVILNWNGKKFLADFFPKVVECATNGAQIFVADNASSDDSVEFLKNNFPSVTIIQHDTNTGFAKGYNDALKNIDAEYYVLLNSDVEVTENWIGPVIQLMNENKNIGACQPKIRNYYTKKQFEYAGAAGGFIDTYGYPFCRGRIFNSLEEDLGQYDTVAEIFWATGACMIVRANVFHEVGGFDEEFFAHIEEIDLCWRIKNAGYTIMFCPHSTVFHVGGGTLPKESPQKTYLNFRNSLLMLHKNAPSQHLFQILIFRLMLDGLAGFVFLLTGHIGDCIAVIKARIYFCLHYPRLRRKRKEQQQKIKFHNTSCIYQGSIVFDYFLRGKKRFSDGPF
jgi:hypothetical protein